MDSGPEVYFQIIILIFYIPIKSLRDGTDLQKYGRIVKYMNQSYIYYCKDKAVIKTNNRFKNTIYVENREFVL